MKGKIIANRYKINYPIDERYFSFSSDQITEYYATDTLHKQSVKVKFYELPKKNNARSISISLWEREVRLIRKAYNFKGGDVLTKILDAALLEEENKLYIVYDDFGLSIAEWEDNPEGLWFFGDLEFQERVEIWQYFEELLSGLEVLHQSKLLHRNINPSTLFYSEESDTTKLKLGGFTWSLYLHNLDYIPEKQMQSGKSSTIFQQHQSLKQLDSIFSEDLFSLGMVITYVFVNEFPDLISLDSESAWKTEHEMILSLIDDDQNLTDKEKSALTSLISVNPQERPRTVSDIKYHIREVISSFTNQGNTIDQPLKVSWYNKVDSYFLRNISSFVEKPIDEIMADPNDWLATEFDQAQVYLTGLKRHPLIILTQSDLLFSLEPNEDKVRNRLQTDVLKLGLIRPRDRRAILTKIRTMAAFTTLESGVRFVERWFERDPLSKSASLYAKALSIVNQRIDNNTPERNFVNSLVSVLEAEKQLDELKMLKFKRLSVRRNASSKTETAEILVSLDFNEEMRGRLKQKLLDMLFDYKNNDGGIIELSLSNCPSSNWDNYREWRLVSVRNNLRCKLERELKGRNKELDEEGVIRPFSMNLSLNLYRRKERLIEHLEDNNQLLTAILNPESSTFYMGIENSSENPMIAKIINTVPMFLVQGPPGTGKTWVASTLISTILKNNPYSRILVASKDHEPLDHLVEAVVEKIKSIELEKDQNPIIVRAMSAEREQEYASSDLVFSYSSQNIVKTILKDSKRSSIETHSLPDGLDEEWDGILDANIVNPSLKWSDEIQKVANVVFATATSSTVQWLSNNAPPYDWVILEEAAKAYPTELLLPMNLGQRWLLIGDQKQLPPYQYDEILNKVSDILDGEQEDQEENIDKYQEKRQQYLTNIKLFEKLFTKFKNVTVLFSEDRYHPSILLSKQWRMPPLIANMIGEIFYDQSFEIMKEDPEVGAPFIEPRFLKSNVLTWIDIPHVSTINSTGEAKDSSGSSYSEYEVNIIIQLLKSLKLQSNDIDDEYEDVVILTPYTAQKEKIRQEIMNHEYNDFSAQKLARNCYTVDSYQGKQANVVIVSLVRNNTISNIRGALGFLTLAERLNVMFSRVRQRMIIIGASNQIKQFSRDIEAKEINEIYDYVDKKGIIIPAEDLEDEL